MYEYSRPKPIEGNVLPEPWEEGQIVGVRASGMEVDGGVLLLHDEFGKVVHAVGPGGWCRAWRSPAAAAGDPSVAAADGVS